MNLTEFTEKYINSLEFNDNYCFDDYFEAEGEDAAYEAARNGDGANYQPATLYRSNGDPGDPEEGGYLEGIDNFYDEVCDELFAKGTSDIKNDPDTPDELKLHMNSKEVLDILRDVFDDTVCISSDTFESMANQIAWDMYENSRDSYFDY